MQARDAGNHHDPGDVNNASGLHGVSRRRVGQRRLRFGDGTFLVGHVL